MKGIMHQNRLRVYIYMAVMIIILGLLGSFLSKLFHWGAIGTGVFLILGGIINLVAYFFSDSLIMRASKAKLLSSAQAPELFTIVEALSKKIQIPMPKIYLLEDSSMNAFATGRNPKHAAVAVTRGLLEKLTSEEVKGVVAHELSHIHNWDTLLMTVIAILAGLISILADVYWRSKIFSKAQGEDRSGAFAFVSLALAVFAPLTAMFIQLAISRQREFMADASGAKITHHPFYLASALQKIGRDHRMLPGMNTATAHLYFSNPMREGGVIDKLFSTHPPVGERIQRLNELSV